MLCRLGRAERARLPEVTLREYDTLPVVPVDFIGLSYELAQLTDPNFWRRDYCWREVDFAGRRSGVEETVRLHVPAASGFLLSVT